jgi:cytochrome c
MSGLEINKTAGAILVALIAYMVVNILGDALVKPRTGGGQVSIATKPADTAPAAPAPVEPIGPLLAQADLAAGQNSFKKCAACHTPEKGGRNLVGPNLWNIVGNKPGSIGGFSYSQGMAAKDGPWDYEALNRFVAAPRAVVPGTKMAFAGINSARERADLIAYLRTLSDSPKPLP